MAKQEPQQLIRNIYQMLFELATGNLSYRLDEPQHCDGLDNLITNLNQFAKQLQSAFLIHGYVSPRYTYQNLVHLSLILDDTQVIINCTSGHGDIMGHPRHKLMGSYFTDILSEQSIDFYESIRPQTPTCLDAITGHLIFRSAQNELIPLFCTIHMLHNGNIIISSITTILQDLLYDLQRVKQTHAQKAKATEAETMQELHDYILSNLDKPLPTLKQLAKIYRVNEFDLKHGFRTFFHTSIHHFYNEERLKRAHVMITNTDVNLKIVAVANGFTNYTSFYKAFKKKFGYAPGQLSRNQ